MNVNRVGSLGMDSLVHIDYFGDVGVKLVTYFFQLLFPLVLNTEVEKLFTHIQHEVFQFVVQFNHLNHRFVSF